MTPPEAFAEVVRDHLEVYGLDLNPERVSSRLIAALAAAGYAIVPVEPTEIIVEEVRRAMSPEKFVSHMRAMDCWAAGIAGARGEKWDADGSKFAAAKETK